MRFQFSSTIPVESTPALSQELSELVSWECDPLEYNLVCLELVEETEDLYEYRATMEKSSIA